MTRIWARLKEHWIRHLLAALQVAVGVAVVAAVFVDVVPVLRASSASREATVFSAVYGGSSGFGAFQSAAFMIDDIEYLQTQTDSVVAASVYQSSFLTLVHVDGDPFMLRGLAKVSPGFAQVADVRLVAGRFFDDSEARVEEPRVAVISNELAELLFAGQDPIGQVINLRPESEAMRVAGYSSPFQRVSSEGNPGLDVRVIGVFEYPEGTPTFSGFLAETTRVELFIPATGRLSRTLSGMEIIQMSSESLPPTEAPIPQEQYTQLIFRAADGMGALTAAEVEALLLPRIEARRPAGGGSDMPSTLIISEATSGAEMMRRSQMTGSLILGAMGIAALIVSGFSIFTTFLAGVAERVRAIGLARALGATRLRILREIVGEAIALSGFGGIVGVALSFPVRFVALKPLLFALDSPPDAIDYVITIGLALLLAIGVGAIASLYPGWTVARMMPAEAFFEE